MSDGTFADGYLDGWQSVAGDAALPPVPKTKIPPGKSAFQAGFEYGRAEALWRASPRTNSN